MDYLIKNGGKYFRVSAENLGTQKPFAFFPYASGEHKEMFMGFVEVSKRRIGDTIEPQELVVPEFWEGLDVAAINLELNRLQKPALQGPYLTFSPDHGYGVFDFSKPPAERRCSIDAYPEAGFRLIGWLDSKGGIRKSNGSHIDDYISKLMLDMG